MAEDEENYNLNLQHRKFTIISVIDQELTRQPSGKVSDLLTNVHKNIGLTKSFESYLQQQDSTKRCTCKYHRHIQIQSQPSNS